VIAIFWHRLLAAVKLQNRIDLDCPNAQLLLAVVFAAAQLAFDLDMRPFRRDGGELGKLAENDATV
jgi:hypothetical protein